MARYSQAFKERIVQKLLLPNAITAQALSKEVNVSRVTLRSWVREFQKLEGRPMTKKSIRPNERPLNEKLELIIKAEQLNGEAYGIFLRTEGLTSEIIHSWKQDFIGKTENENTISSKDEIRKLKRENQILEKDIRKKDKALAEVTALLILKKKADLLWGVDEEQKFH